MANTVECVRCEGEKDGLESPPMGGATGQRLMESVCQDCWQEWRETSAQIINHYGLVLGNPQHRAELRRLMREFLNLEETSAEANSEG